MASFEKGPAVGREVLGTEHIDVSLVCASDFSKPMRQLVTEYCRGAFWTRDALDRQTPSRIDGSMLTAVNRRHAA